MTEDHLYHNQSKDFSSTSFLANYTFNSKANRESFLDLKDPKAAVEIELNLLKEQHRRTLGDLAKANSQNKELKLEVLQLTSKLKLKDQEIDDLKTQSDPKMAPGRKLQERDMNLPRSVTIKSSFTEKTLDGKTMRSMLNNENCPEKLTVQNKALKKEIEKLAEKLKKYEEEKIRECSEKYQKMNQELPSKIKAIESSNNSLLKENQCLKDQVEKLSVESSQLKKDNMGIKRTYEDLKSRYESLETTATSNRADYSTDGSGATSESATGNKNFTSKKFTVRFNPETTKWPTKGYSVDMSGDDNRKLIVEIMDTYGVNSPWEIIPSIQKTEKVVQMVPKLRKMLSEIAAMVLPRVGTSKDKANIELVLPAVKKMCKEFDDSDGYKNLRNKLVDVLGLDKDCINLDILRKVDKQATFCFQSSEVKSQASESRSSIEDTMLSTQFVKVFGTQPSMPVFKHIIKQLEEYRHFLSVIKNKLKLDQDTKNEICLAHMVKTAEHGIKDKQIVEIIHRLQSLLNCNPDAIVYNIERMMFDTKREKRQSQHKGSFVNH